MKQPRPNPCTCERPYARLIEGGPRDSWGPDSVFIYCGHCGAKLGWESQVELRMRSLETAAPARGGVSDET